MKRKITAIKNQKSNKHRLNIYIDGEFSFGLTRTVGKMLQVGQEIDDETFIDLQFKDSVENAYKRALNLLNYRQRSDMEIRRNLMRHQVPESVVNEVVCRLERNGLLDDLKFAQAWVENRSVFRPRSRRALSYELRQKGIPHELIERVVNVVDDDEMAYQAAQKVSNRFMKEDWSAYQRKMKGYLARRGFQYWTISNVIQKTWNEVKTERKK